MSPLVMQIIATLDDPKPDERALDDATLNAVFLFEEARGFTPCGWTEEVLATTIEPDDVPALKQALARYIARVGGGTYILGKSDDPTFIPLYKDILRCHATDNGDRDEMFQAMIVLDNLGENVFQGRTSRSLMDRDLNLRLAREYLATPHGSPPAP